MSSKISTVATTFIVSFIAGMASSVILMFAAAVVMFGLGAQTGVPYRFSLGPMLVFRIDVSEGNLGMVFGVGFPAIAFALGLVNALTAVMLKAVRPLKTQPPSD